MYIGHLLMALMLWESGKRRIEHLGNIIAAGKDDVVEGKGVGSDVMDDSMVVSGGSELAGGRLYAYFDTYAKDPSHSLKRSTHAFPATTTSCTLCCY